MYLVYILKSDNLSYVGMTNDFFRRFRQHNQEIKGGAKYTKKRTSWYPICIIDGFETMKEAMQCEWRLKRGKGGPQGRINYLNDYKQNNDKWTSKSPFIKDQNLTIYLDQEFIMNNLVAKELYWKE
jgi:predicted GIY-YIG superfamily endonuclease|tara:strand:+ start:187 stop:564 length:378 start_codon:yes stop_codon:yes gene_type:complete